MLCFTKKLLNEINFKNLKNVVKVKNPIFFILYLTTYEINCQRKPKIPHRYS